VTGSGLEGQPLRADTATMRWLLVKAGCGRVGRWAVFSVALATIPTLASILYLPPSSTLTSLLKHGDFAILASALVAAAMGELFGPDEPQKWIRNVLVSASILLFTCTIVLLGGIAGDSPRLSPEADVRYSWMSFGIAIIIGTASWGLTAHRCSAKTEGGATRPDRRAEANQE
jgi:hypothetical protein